MGTNLAGWGGSRFNGANPIAYNYDAEGLLTGAGELTLTRQAPNGLLTGTTLRPVTTQLTHNPFGELASETVQFLSETERSAFQKELSEASCLLDHSREFFK